MKKNKRITVTKIAIDYGLDKIDIDLKIGKNLEKHLTLKGEIYKILDNRRNVLKETKSIKTCIQMTGSIKEGYSLAKRANPIVIAVLNAMEDKGKALLYLTGMINNSNWDNTNLLIEENFSNAKLNKKYMKLVKRYVESEKKHLSNIAVITKKKEEIDNKRKSKKISKKLINKDKKTKKKMKNSKKSKMENSAKISSGKVKKSSKFKSLLRVDLKAMNNNEKISKETSQNKQSKDINGNDLEI